MIHGFREEIRSTNTMIRPFLQQFPSDSQFDVRSKKVAAICSFIPSV